MIDYFYNETNLGSGIIADLWRFNASTGIGAFTGNSAVVVQGAGESSVNGVYTERGSLSNRPYYNLSGESTDQDFSSIIYTSSWNIIDENGDVVYGAASNSQYPWLQNYSPVVGSPPAPTVTPIVTNVSGNNFEDFSLYFTYEKKQVDYNSGAVALFSNYSGNGGFTFGLDANNFPFLKAGGEAFTFDDFSLGGKNTLCFQKAGNSFSLTRYDHNSSGIFQSQNYFTSPQIQLSGGNYIFGTTLDNISGIGRFYGNIDQLLFVSEKISDADSLTIFSGFSNISVVKNEFISYEVESSEWFIPNSGFNSGLQNLFQNYFTGVYQDYVLDEALAQNSEFVGRITFSGVSGGYQTRNYYGSGGIGFCQTGASIQMGYPDFMGSGTGLPNNFTVDLNFTVGPIVEGFYADEMFFTYNLPFYPGLRYSNLWRLTKNEEVILTPNSGYYSGFQMQGILAPNADLSLLGEFNTSFKNVGNEAIFDSVSGVFFAPNAVSGLPVYLNGLKETGIILSSGIIDIVNYTESSSDEIIYDRVSGLSLINLSTSSSSLGEFYPGTSFVATGLFSFDTMYRVSNDEFYETHPFHLYHGKDWHNPSSLPIYDNSTGNWT